jgi:hypothetical protein
MFCGQATLAESSVTLSVRGIGKAFMTPSTPSESYIVSIARPHCAKCGNLMMLARIEPDTPDHDRRTFECANCGHSEVTVARYR